MKPTDDLERAIEYLRKRGSARSDAMDRHLRISSADELLAWQIAEGKIIHCQPHLLAAESERRLFRDRPELRMKMLGTFLSAAVAGFGKNVHVAGTIEGEA